MHWNCPTQNQNVKKITFYAIKFCILYFRNFGNIDSSFVPHTHIEIPLGDEHTRLLEEHDLTNVLNQLPVDAFNDLFQGNKTTHKQTQIHVEPKPKPSFLRE